jgi:hypothetical protein
MTLSNKLSTMMLILSTSIIQWHSIQFWIEVAESIGFLWSIAIEAAAVWLWWHKKTVLAFLASFLLMTGPLYSLSIPIYESDQYKVALASSHQQKIDLAHESIKSLKQSLVSYQQNSLSRVGWAARIDETRNELQAETANMKSLINAAPKLKQSPMPWLVIAIEVLGLTVLLLTQVLTIQALRGISVKSKQPETAEDLKHDYSELALALSSRLSDTLSAEGLSQAEWARRNDVSAKSISMLINHQKRSKTGKECISKNELSGIQSALNLTILSRLKITSHW